MKKMNSLLTLLTIMMVAMLSVCITSCGGDDNPVSTPPVPNDGNEQTDVVSNQDPEGTVVVNMNNGSSGNYINIGLGDYYGDIHIDAANNFAGYTTYVEFASVGEVSGLSKITSIPTSGWATSAAVVPGTGYVARRTIQGQCYVGDSERSYRWYYSFYKYVRLYVVEHTVNTAGGIMGATVKYQSPFDLPIVLSTTSLTFTSVESEQTLTLSSLTTIELEEKPEWCFVTSGGDNKITVHVIANNTGQQRTGNIILKNSVSSVTVRVVQQAS